MGHNTISAYEIVNEAPLEDLNSIIKIFGEDNDHKKIAKEIVQIRKNKTIHTTKELRNTILKAKGNRYFKKDPCTKTFQALRMIVNQELSEIFNALKKQ
jgi:Predicted S-adenosylmethionine-dependent methyltransferase involved in cell envelope biogenesis